MTILYAPFRIYLVLVISIIMFDILSSHRTIVSLSGMCVAEES